MKTNMTMPEDPQNGLVKPGWQTSEFVTVAVTVVTNIVAIFVVMGLIPANDQSGLTQALSAAISGMAAVITNGLLVWKYVQSRTEVKTTVANMQASLAMERFHVRIEKQEEGGDGCGDAGCHH